MIISAAQLSGASAFTQPLQALKYSTQQVEQSTLRLSTGSRISRAGDDVAAFSIATRLQSQLVGLKQANSNAVQADSMLQVAQGGLEQILELLDRNDAIATQANTSSLTTADRNYLQAEFAANLSEVDRIAANTKFNDIALLDGTLSGENKAQTTTTASTKATATIAFSQNIAATETVTINGVDFVEGTDFDQGLTVSATIDDLIDAIELSTDTRITAASYERSGDSLVITANAGGDAGNNFTVDLSDLSTTFAVTGTSTQVTDVYTLSGGADDGLSIGTVVSSGTIGDAIVNTQSQVKGSVTLSITGTVVEDETILIDDGNGSSVTFTFKDSASGSDEIQIGADTEETLQNIISTISQYSGNDNFVTRQLEFEIDGNDLTIRNNRPGNPDDYSGANPDISETITNGALSAATITGGSNTGIDTSGVTNGDFVGSITGFSATYVGADSITASITVGSSTYSASITDTTPGSNTTVRFTSTSGGYFDVQLAASQGQAVTNSTTATSYASRLNSAIEGLTFYQARPVSNFEATGDFVGASADLQLSDFTDIRIDSIDVTAPVDTGEDATIDIVINGETLRASSGIGGTLGAYETLKFTSLDNANKVLYLNNGSSVQDFSSTANAATFETSLRSAFGLDEAGSGLDFQVGTSTTDKVTVVVNTSTVSSLFNGTTPSVTTQSNAASAQTSIDTARESVLETLATVGALQSRFQSAQDVNNKIIEGVTAARSQLADTDIAEESTAYALATLRVNSGVAVIAQTQRLQSSLLSVLQNGLQN